VVDRPAAARRALAVLFNLLAVVLGVVMVVVWSSAHAIRLIDANFLSENFSVDEKYDEYISSSALSDRFIVWEQSGTILMSIEVAIMALLLIDTLVARHHNCTTCPTRRRSTIWSASACAQVALVPRAGGPRVDAARAAAADGVWRARRRQV
jgi:hypothetical protein